MVFGFLRITCTRSLDRFVLYQNPVKTLLLANLHLNPSVSLSFTVIQSGFQSRFSPLWSLLQYLSGSSNILGLSEDVVDTLSNTLCSTLACAPTSGRHTSGCGPREVSYSSDLQTPYPTRSKWKYNKVDRWNTVNDRTCNRDFHQKDFRSLSTVSIRGLHFQWTRSG